MSGVSIFYLEIHSFVMMKIINNSQPWFVIETTNKNSKWPGSRELRLSFISLPFSQARRLDMSSATPPYSSKFTIFPWAVAIKRMADIKHFPGMLNMIINNFLQFTHTVPLRKIRSIREALKKITILLLTFVKKGFARPPSPYLLTKNHYIKKVSKNTEKQLICNFSQPPEPPVLQPL